MHLTSGGRLAAAAAQRLDLATIDALNFHRCRSLRPALCLLAACCQPTRCLVPVCSLPCSLLLPCCPATSTAAAVTFLSLPPPAGTTLLWRPRMAQGPSRSRCWWAPPTAWASCCPRTSRRLSDRWVGGWVGGWLGGWVAPAQLSLPACRPAFCTTYLAPSACLPAPIARPSDCRACATGCAAGASQSDDQDVHAAGAAGPGGVMLTWRGLGGGGSLAG